MRCAARWERPAPRSSSSPAASPTAPSRPPRGTRGASCSTAPRSARPAHACARRRSSPQHVPDMLRYRRAAREADVVHFQWLPVQHLDAHLLPRRTAGRARRARWCSPPTTSSRASPSRAARGPAAAVRALRRDRRPLRARPRAPDRGAGRRSRARARDPPRRRSHPSTPRRRRGSPPPFQTDRPRGAVLRSAAPLQGPRCAARGLARRRRRRAVDRRHATYGHLLAAGDRSGERALRAALRLRRRDGRVLHPRRPRRAALPRDRPVGRRCSPRSARACRCCSATSAAFPSWPPPAPRARSRGGRRRAARGAAGAAGRSSRPGGDGRARPRRRGRPVLMGGDRPPTLDLYRSLAGLR